MSITKNLTFITWIYNIVFMFFILDSLIVILMPAIITHLETEVVDTSRIDEDWCLITVTTGQADEVSFILDKFTGNGVISKERIFYKYLKDTKNFYVIHFIIMMLTWRRLITVTTGQADEVSLILDKLIGNVAISKERIFCKYLKDTKSFYVIHFIIMMLT